MYILLSSLYHVIELSVFYNIVRILTAHYPHLILYFQTANTLSFVLYHLAKNPLVQDRLYDEIKQCCVHGEITASTFANMPFLKACIKESLR